MERELQELRGGAVPSRPRLTRRSVFAHSSALALSLGLVLASPARADLGVDLASVQRALAPQAQAAPLRLRLMERGDVTPVALPAWALDAERGDCTTLVFLAPVPTQFIVHVHPWPGLPSIFASSAGALQLTRCGRDRASLLQVMVEMRSPRAALHTWAAVGAAAPAPLIDTLPERDAGSPAPFGDVGPELPRRPIAERLQRFELLAREAGAASLTTQPVPSSGYARVALAPGCHRLLATTAGVAGPYSLLVQHEAQAEPERYEASDDGDVREELCTARPETVLVSLDSQGASSEHQLGLASFPLPQGLPGRFGPDAAVQLLRALGGSSAPKRLGTLVSASLGAQGRTPLPRALLPQTCYLAAAAVIHGQASGVSLAVQAGTQSSQSTSADGSAGPRIGFCTGRDGHVDLDVEARGGGVAWLFTLFLVGPARVEQP